MISSVAERRSSGSRSNSSAAAISRSPLGPWHATTEPSSASSTAGRSDAGSPWASEPPIVPRWRTCGSAIVPAAARQRARGRRRRPRRAASSRRSGTLAVGALRCRAGRGRGAGRPAASARRAAASSAAAASARRRAASRPRRPRAARRSPRRATRAPRSRTRRGSRRTSFAGSGRVRSRRPSPCSEPGCSVARPGRAPGPPGSPPTPASA